ncbi:MAG: heme-binding protein, partial [Planctomycetaceae bacterium]
QAGPGLVAPIGVGGHFPPEIAHTPPVDLFAIEHTNRDSITDAGGLAARFDATFAAGQEVTAPESYGLVSGRATDQQARGIATLPGGIPLFRDSDCDGVGDTLVGGIGVFFPGSDGYATHEQGFVAGIGQTELERTNASRVLEAEYIAYAAAGGSTGAETFGTGAPGARIGPLAGEDRVENLDLPFDVLTLVGITLQVVGPTAGIEGVREILATGQSLGPGVVNGTLQPINVGGGLSSDGTAVPQGWLVDPKNGNGISASEVESIINRGIQAAERVRAAVRLPRSSPTRMVFSVTDLDGEVVGLHRMPDATFFSIDVAVAKARNVAYYSDASKLQPEDRVPGVAPGVAFTNRTFRFLAEGRFPDGVEASQPGPLSILNEPSINNQTAENIGAPAPVTDFNDTILGNNSFNPSTNFHDTANADHQNGVVFFPGSTPLYRNGTLIGGFGVSGDGVDQDDVVTFLAARDFLPDSTITRADQTSVDGVRLPYMKFLRNPFRDVKR